MLLTTPTSDSGLLISVGVGVSGPKRAALQAAGLAIPAVSLVRGLIDTGADCTAIDAAVVKSLGLVPTGTTKILTPSTGPAGHDCDLFDVAIYILMGSAQIHTASLTTPVIGTSLSTYGYDVLLGRDVLSQGLLIYDGKAGSLSLAF